MLSKVLILIIEDEEDILELEEFHLQNAGFETMGFLSTKGVEQALEEENVSLLIVDRNLPGIEGSEFVVKLRQKGYEQPVIFVTAKDSDSNVEEGFARGADDYLKKPFNMNELVLRVKALLKRSGYMEESKLVYKDLKIDTEAHKVERSGEEIPLTKLEFNLLSYLIRCKNRVVSREELLNEVWHEDEERGNKSVNVAINRRKKEIYKDSKNSYIEPVRGIGYRLC